MAKIHDQFHASVSVDGSQATSALSGLSAKAKQTDKSLGDLSKGGSESSQRLTNSLKGTGAAAAGMTGGIAAASGKLGQFGLAAATGATVGLAVAGALGEASKAASGLTEATNASRVTFGEASKQVEEFSTKAAAGLGLSQRAALDAAAKFGVLFQAVGFSNEASAQFSQSLLRLSADLASTFGGSVDDAALALRALFRGEGDPIEKYGVKVQETDTKLQAMRLGLAGANGEISNQDKTLARLTLVYQQTAKAQGDFSRTQADLANQQRILTAQLENGKAAIGGLVNPAINDTLTGFNTLMGASSDKVKGFNANALALDVGAAVLTGGVSLLGKASKDASDQFKDMPDALRVYAQESANGRAESKLAKDAIAFLKDETKKAEAAAKGLADAMTDEARAAELLRQNTDAARTSLQGLVSANRGAEDATLRVGTATRTLADARRTLGDLMAKGKVDQEEVTRATERLADATQRVADADQKAQDARRELNELLVKGKYDLKEIERAERDVAAARRGETEAARGLIEAEKELEKLRAGPTGRESQDADTAVKRARLAKAEAEERQRDAVANLNKARGGDRADAQRDLESAQLDVIEATNALSDAIEAQTKLANRGKEGSDELADAERRVEEARLAGEEATRRRSDAEAADRLARAGDPKFEEEVAARRRGVADADRDAAGARLDRNRAEVEARKARAGDPDFEHKVAEATERVRDAQRDVQRALEDLPFALENAKSKQDEFNRSIAEGNAVLAEQARLLGVAVEPSNLQIPLQVGNAINDAYNAVRMRGASASGASGSQTINLVVDGRTLAQVVTANQQRSAQQGGAR